jgi:hypothetical protein
MVLVQEGLTIEEMHLMPGQPRMALSGGNKSGGTTVGGITAGTDSVAGSLTVQVISYKKMNYAVSREPEWDLGQMWTVLFPEIAGVIRKLIPAQVGRSVNVKKLSANATYDLG